MKKSDVALLRPVLSDNGEINENARAVARLKKTDGRDVVSVSICGLPNRTGGEYYFFLEGNIPDFRYFRRRVFRLRPQRRRGYRNLLCNAK